MNIKMSIIFRLFFLFVLAQLIGLYTAMVIIGDIPHNPYVQSFLVTNDGKDPMNAIYLFMYILIGAFLVMIFIRLHWAELLFRLLEIMLIATASSLVFYSIFRFFLGYELSMAGGIILGIAFALLKLFFPLFKNAATILATAGVGVVFGISLGILPAVVLIFLLSVYDYIAVFKTKHMVEMADFLIKKDLSFTVTAREYLPEVKREARIDLGSGDIVAPIMLEVSALSLSPAASLTVLVGAGFSLLIFLLLAFRRKIVLPALPPIAFGMIIALMLGRLIGLY